MATKTRKQRRATVAADSTLPLCIEFVLDETGSMNRITNQTVAGFNDFLNEQRQGSGECRITLTKFSDQDLRTPYEDLLAFLVPEMTRESFCANGGTNLYDAIGHRATQLKNRLVKWSVQPRVLFVVMTDGMDNTSTEYSENSIRHIIEENPDWTFVYLGADQNALSIGNRMGFHDGNIQSFAKDSIHETMTTLSKATTAFRASGASTKAFF